MDLCPVRYEVVVAKYHMIPKYSAMEKLFDQIVLKDGTKLYGIIDFATTKHLYFFDFTKDRPEELVFQAILWKGNDTGVRFSIYMAIESPGYLLPRTILIPIRAIHTCTGSTEKTRKTRRRRVTLS